MIQIIRHLDHKRYCARSPSIIVNTMLIKPRQFRVTALLWITLSTGAIGQTHEGHSDGMSHAHASTDIPIEAGQSAFSAIAEIVALLESDPHTDWSTINIDALRDHLVDMSNLTLSALVTTRELDERTIQFKVVGDMRTRDSIQTMVPAHMQMVGNSHDWRIEVIAESDGVTLKVTPTTSEDYTKLKALGFFGLMTIGAHHQLHHLQIARGAGH